MIADNKNFGDPLVVVFRCSCGFETVSMSEAWWHMFNTMPMTGPIREHELIAEARDRRSLGEADAE